MFFSCVRTTQPLRNVFRSFCSSSSKEGRFHRSINSSNYQDAQKKAETVWKDFEDWRYTTQFEMNKIEPDLKRIRRRQIYKNVKSSINNVFRNIGKRIGLISADPLFLYEGKNGFDTDRMREIVTYYKFREFGIRSDEIRKPSPFLLSVQENLRGLEGKSFDSPEVNELFHKKILPYYNDFFTHQQRSWIEEKFKTAAELIPTEIMEKRGYDKFLKVVVGTVAHKLRALDATNQNLSQNERSDEIFKSIQAGYYFGLTYPLVDDLIDSSQFLSADEKRQVMDLIISALGGELSSSQFPSLAVVQELKKLFDEFSQLFPREQNPALYRSLEVLAISQARDQDRSFDNEIDFKSLIYASVLKAAFSRIVPMCLAGSVNEDLIDHLYVTALRNQWSDDFTDINEDFQTNTVTAFTYFLKKDKCNLISPLELYFSLIYYITDQHENSEIREILIKRAIQGIGELSKQIDPSEFVCLLNKLGIREDSNIYRLILKLINSLNNINIETDVFARLSNLILKHLNYVPRVQSFEEELKSYRRLLEVDLPVRSTTLNEDNPDLILSMNFSLLDGGKRLRPILLFMSGKELGLRPEVILPCAKAIEYLHTASLILDDLPAQDNATLRRGRATNHVQFKESTSQLAVVGLIAESFSLLSTMNKHFDSDIVCIMTQYVSEVIGHKGLCQGQILDLDNRKDLSIQQLQERTYLKTGIAIEASLMIPALLTKQSADTIMMIKQFSRNLGLAFQIKDDLLDITGDSQDTGKDKNLDVQNETQTYVSVLGVKGAQELLQNTQHQLLSDVERLQFKSPSIKKIINWVATRKA